MQLQCVLVEPWSVCLLVLSMSPAKTAELRCRLGFGLFWGPRNHILGGSVDPHGTGHNWACQNLLAVDIVEFTC